MMTFLRRLQSTYQRWQDDDGAMLAAAVAYYAALSFFPLLLVLISGLGFFLKVTEWGKDSRQQVLTAIGEYASSAVQQNVEGILNNVQDQASVAGPVGLVTLLFTAIALFAQFDRAFDHIWNVPSRKDQGILPTVKNILFERLRAFLVLLALGVLILVIAVMGVALTSARTYAQDFLPMNDVAWRILETTMSVILSSGVFCLVFKLLPKVPVKWSEAYQGAVLTAVVWELGRLALTSFLVGDKYSAYGVVGSFIAVMLWIYYASTVLFLGAEYIQATRENG